MSRAVLALSIATWAAWAVAQPQAGAGLRGRFGLEDRLGASDVLTALGRVRVATADLRGFVRLSVDWPSLERASGGDWSALDERLAAYQRWSMPVVLAIGPRAESQGTDTWVPVLQAIARHLRGRVAGYQIEAAVPRPAAREYAFQLKLASVQIRAIDSQAAIAQVAARSDDVSWLAAVYAEGTAPYVDLAFLAAPAEFGAVRDPAVEASIVASDPSAVRIQIGVGLGDRPAEGVRRLLTTVIAEVGRPDVIGSTFVAGADVLVPALEAAAALKDLLAGNLLAIDDATVSLRIEAGGRDVTATWPHRIFYGSADGGMYLAYWGGASADGDLTFSFDDPRGRRPVIRDPVSRATGAVGSFAWDAEAKRSRVTARVSATPLVLDFNAGTSSGFVSRSDVSTARSLSVEEIVARNQQAQAANANAFRAYIATLRTEIHFRPTATQVFDIVTDNRFFSGPDTVEWEELTFSVNGAKWGPDRPGLPLLQAEKVLSLPLDLRLGADYRYTLEGTETVGERSCYVVAFEPNERAASSYRGRVWIDAESFLRLKLQTIQTHLTGPIVSSEEITRYEQAPASGGVSVILPSRQSTKQILLIAGRNVLLEKEQWFTDYRVDPADFESAREAARASKHIMYRDTAAGTRYLVTRGAVRVVSEDLRTTNKALALGVTIDPTFAYPLPIVGLNYLNFNVRGSDNQLALLFGGVFLAGNLQNPRVGRTPFDMSLDFFGIAVPGTDQRFDAAGERRGERVLTVPVSAGVNFGYQFTPFQKVSTGYSWRYDAYFREPNTAEDFTVPSHTSTHGVGVGYEYSRHGYRFGAAASAYVRQAWTAWGPADDLRSDGKTYRRYSVGGGKDFLFGPFQSVHVGAGWHGGAHLDRFSVYQFGLFNELRMHGVPAAGVRFSELMLVRGSYSFNLLGLYRLDLFVDHAQGRELERRDNWESVTGTGVALTLKTPWNTMLTADVGRSWLPGIYQSAGSTVLQFLVLKPF
jgi:hypothetical protein